MMDKEYPDGLPTGYAIFQVAGDRDSDWYGVWLELDASGAPERWHAVSDTKFPDDEPPQAYVTKEYARRACWRDEWGYLE